MALGVRVNSNAVGTQLGSPRAILKRVVVGDPGTAWTLTLKDGGTTKVVLKPTVAGFIEVGLQANGEVQINGAGGVQISAAKAGWTVDSAGTTPGDVLFVLE